MNFFLKVYAFAMKDRINNVPRKSDDANDQNSVKTKKFRFFFLYMFIHLKTFAGSFLFSSHKDWHKNYTKVASLKETDGETSLKVVSSYIPCVHDANNVNCNEQPCCCIERSTFCEKFCNCSSDCKFLDLDWRKQFWRNRMKLIWLPFWHF